VEETPLLLLDRLREIGAMRVQAAERRARLERMAAEVATQN